MTYASPGPISTSVPSSWLTPSRPEWTTPTWRAWQLSVPATGLTHSDHRHPGSNANRPTVVAPMRTTSTCVLSGVRVSSGESKSRVSTPATAVSSPRLTLRLSRSRGRVASEVAGAVAAPLELGAAVGLSAASAYVATRVLESTVIVVGLISHHVLGYLMYRSGLVPQPMALLGLIGRPPERRRGDVRAVRRWEQTSATQAILT